VNYVKTVLWVKKFPHVAITNPLSKDHGNDCIYPSPGKRQVKDARLRETVLLRQRIAELENMLRPSETDQEKSQFQEPAMCPSQESRVIGIDYHKISEQSTKIGMSDNNSHESSTSICTFAARHS
jgi:hypothetical protein